MATLLSNNYNILSLSSYDSSLIFNEYNDIMHGSIAILRYKNKQFTYNNISCFDPFYGQMYFTKQT